MEKREQVAKVMFSYKLVFLGNSNVGKTSIIQKFIFDTFDKNHHVRKQF